MYWPWAGSPGRPPPSLHRVVPPISSDTIRSRTSSISSQAIRGGPLRADHSLKAPRSANDREIEEINARAAARYNRARPSKVRSRSAQLHPTYYTDLSDDTDPSLGRADPGDTGANTDVPRPSSARRRVYRIRRPQSAPIFGRVTPVSQRSDVEGSGRSSVLGEEARVSQKEDTVLSRGRSRTRQPKSCGETRSEEDDKKRKESPVQFVDKEEGGGGVYRQGSIRVHARYANSAEKEAGSSPQEEDTSTLNTDKGSTKYTISVDEEQRTGNTQVTECENSELDGKEDSVSDHRRTRSGSPTFDSDTADTVVDCRTISYAVSHVEKTNAGNSVDTRTFPVGQSILVCEVNVVPQENSPSLERASNFADCDTDKSDDIIQGSVVVKASVRDSEVGGQSLKEESVQQFANLLASGSTSSLNTVGQVSKNTAQSLLSSSLQDISLLSSDSKTQTDPHRRFSEAGATSRPVKPKRQTGVRTSAPLAQGQLSLSAERLPSSNLQPYSSKFGSVDSILLDLDAEKKETPKKTKKSRFKSWFSSKKGKYNPGDESLPFISTGILPRTQQQTAEDTVVYKNQKFGPRSVEALSDVSTNMADTPEQTDAGRVKQKAIYSKFFSSQAQDVKVLPNKPQKKIHAGGSQSREGSTKTATEVLVHEASASGGDGTTTHRTEKKISVPVNTEHNHDTAAHTVITKSVSVTTIPLTSYDKSFIVGDGGFSEGEHHTSTQMFRAKPVMLTASKDLDGSGETSGSVHQVKSSTETVTVRSARFVQHQVMADFRRGSPEEENGAAVLENHDATTRSATEKQSQKLTTFVVSQMIETRTEASKRSEKAADPDDVTDDSKEENPETIDDKSADPSQARPKELPQAPAKPKRRSAAVVKEELSVAGAVQTETAPPERIYTNVKPAEGADASPAHGLDIADHVITVDAHSTPVYGVKVRSSSDSEPDEARPGNSYANKIYEETWPLEHQSSKVMFPFQKTSSQTESVSSTTVQYSFKGSTTTSQSVSNQELSSFKVSSKFAPIQSSPASDASLSTGSSTATQATKTAAEAQVKHGEESKAQAVKPSVKSIHKSDGETGEEIIEVVAATQVFASVPAKSQGSQQDCKKPDGNDRAGKKVDEDTRRLNSQEHAEGPIDKHTSEDATLEHDSDTDSKSDSEDLEDPKTPTKTHTSPAVAMKTGLGKDRQQPSKDSEESGTKVAPKPGPDQPSKERKAECAPGTARPEAAAVVKSAASPAVTRGAKEARLPPLPPPSFAVSSSTEAESKQRQPETPEEKGASHSHTTLKEKFKRAFSSTSDEGSKKSSPKTPKKVITPKSPKVESNKRAEDMSKEDPKAAVTNTPKNLRHKEESKKTAEDTHKEESKSSGHNLLKEKPNKAFKWIKKKLTTKTKRAPMSKSYSLGGGDDNDQDADDDGKTSDHSGTDSEDNASHDSGSSVDSSDDDDENKKKMSKKDREAESDSDSQSDSSQDESSSKFSWSFGRKKEADRTSKDDPGTLSAYRKKADWTPAGIEGGADLGAGSYKKLSDWSPAGYSANEGVGDETDDKADDGRVDDDDDYRHEDSVAAIKTLDAALENEVADLNLPSAETPPVVQKAVPTPTVRLTIHGVQKNEDNRSGRGGIKKYTTSDEEEAGKGETGTKEEDRQTTEKTGTEVVAGQESTVQKTETEIEKNKRQAAKAQNARKMLGKAPEKPQVSEKPKWKSSQESEPSRDQSISTDAAVKPDQGDSVPRSTDSQEQQESSGNVVPPVVGYNKLTEKVVHMGMEQTVKIKVRPSSSGSGEEDAGKILDNGPGSEKKEKQPLQDSSSTEMDTSTASQQSEGVRSSMYAHVVKDHPDNSTTKEAKPTITVLKKSSKSKDTGKQLGTESSPPSPADGETSTDDDTSGADSPESEGDNSTPVGEEEEGELFVEGMSAQAAADDSKEDQDDDRDEEEEDEDNSPPLPDRKYKQSKGKYNEYCNVIRVSSEKLKNARAKSASVASLNKTNSLDTAAERKKRMRKAVSMEEGLDEETKKEKKQRRKRKKSDELKNEDVKSRKHFSLKAIKSFFKGKRKKSTDQKAVEEENVYEIVDEPEPKTKANNKHTWPKPMQKKSSHTTVAVDSSHSSSDIRPIGRLLQLNADGTQLLELIRPPNGNLGIELTQGNDEFENGIFVSGFVDSGIEKLLSGILNLGDQILKINEYSVQHLPLNHVHSIIASQQRLKFLVNPVSS